jgi:hypothetical protein
MKAEKKYERIWNEVVVGWKVRKLTRNPQKVGVPPESQSQYLSNTISHTYLKIYC